MATLEPIMHHAQILAPVHWDAEMAVKAALQEQLVPGGQVENTNQNVLVPDFFQPIHLGWPHNVGGICPTPNVQVIYFLQPQKKAETVFNKYKRKGKPMKTKLNDRS